MNPDTTSNSPEEATSAHVTEEPVTFITKDHHSLTGTLFQKTASAPPSTAAILNCGAGIAAKAYKRFARYLAANDVAVLTYDYRGIGLSRRGPLRGFQASFEDWAEYDCSAAIDFVRQRFGLPTFGISHSIGALIFGGATNASTLSGLVMIAPHTGYVGDYRRGYRLPMGVFWHGVMPTLTYILGYFPGRRLGLGEDIPKDVAMAWARRRKAQPELAAGSRTLELARRAASIRAQALAITISDDGFATTAGAARVEAFLQSTTLDRQVVTPSQASATKLGHFGFFRARRVWPVVLSFLREHSCARLEHQSEFVPR